LDHLKYTFGKSIAKIKTKTKMYLYIVFYINYNTRTNEMKKYLFVYNILYKMSSVIGQGTFGCVHSPPMKCKGEKEFDASYVSKLIKDANYAAEIENNHNEDMDAYDPNNDFHLGHSTMCSPANTTENREAIKQCKDFNISDIDQYKLIIMKNGGISLAAIENLYKFKPNTVANRKYFERFWLSIYRIIAGIYTLSENRMIHHDIKSQNIVYDNATGRSNLIDFTNLVEYKDNESTGIHWSYPPEVELYNHTTLNHIVDGDKYDAEQYAKNTAITIDEEHPTMSEYTYHRDFNGDYTEFQHNQIKALYKGVQQIKDADEFYFDTGPRIFDIYGLGMALGSMIKNTYKMLGRDQMTTVLKMVSLFDSMVNWNIYERPTPIEVLHQYEQILVKSGWLDKYNMHIKDDKLLEGKSMDDIKLGDEVLTPPDPNQLKEENPLETVFMNQTEPSLKKHKTSAAAGGGAKKHYTKKKKTRRKMYKNKKKYTKRKN
jgi:serine/threonine protein kinase